MRLQINGRINGQLLEKWLQDTNYDMDAHNRLQYREPVAAIRKHLVMYRGSLPEVLVVLEATALGRDALSTVIELADEVSRES